MPNTPNHDYNVPEAGADDWHLPLNENFEQFDTDIEVRGPDGERGDYDPGAGTKYLATDTGDVYVGDGSAWNRIRTTGVSPTLDQLNPGGEFLGVGRSSRVTGREFFGVATPAGNGQYGGMYLGTDGGQGWPFYGYATGGTGRAWTYYHGGERQWRVYNGGDHLAVTRGGNVGVGTRSPSARLDVAGDTGVGGVAGRVTNENDDDVTSYGFRGVSNSSGTASFGVVGESAASSGFTFGVGGFSDSPEGGGVYGYTESSDGYGVFGRANGAGYGLYSDGPAKVDGDLEVTGNKNFVQAVDTDDGSREVVYTAVEAGTPHTEASGVARLVDGRAAIDLPEHFSMVTSDEDPLAVQVTAHAREPVRPQVVERSTRTVVVKDVEDPTRSYEVSYTVKGTREGHADPEVVRDPGDR